MEYRLIYGDCLEEMKDIEPGSIDLILADPPYGTTNCAWDSIIDLDKMWDHLKRIIKLNGAIVLTCAQPFTSVLISSNLQMFKYCWYWKKSQATGHLNAYKMPMRDIEDISVFYTNQPTYNLILSDRPKENIRPAQEKRENTSCYGKHSGPSTRKIPLNKNVPRQLLEFNSPQNNYHPTEKPIELMEYMVKTYTNEGETVLDFCMGSGPSGKACRNLNRSFIGMENDKKHFNTAKNLIEASHNQGSIFDIISQEK